LYPADDAARPISEEEIRSDTVGHKRVWLLLHDERDKPKELAVVRSALADRFQLQSERAFPGEILITVALYDR
jgi:hypothetical protein